MKAKRFAELFAQSLLPDDVQEKYVAAGKKRGSGTMRDEQTFIINRYLTRVKGSKKFKAQPDHPELKEIRVHTKEGFNERYLDGVCWEEACVKAGMSQALEEGVGVGRIKKTGSGDRFKDHMFHFPHCRIGGKETFERKLQGKQEHEVNDQGWKHLAIAMDAMIPDIASQAALPSHEGEIDMQLQLLGGKDGTISAAGPSGHDLAWHMGILKEKKDALCHSVKLCETIVEKSIGIENKPPRLTNSLNALFLTQESAEEVKAEAEFAIKFKKNRDTKQFLTAETASVLVQKVEEMLDELGADVRVCKAHIAEKQKV